MATVGSNTPTANRKPKAPVTGGTADVSATVDPGRTA